MTIVTRLVVFPAVTTSDHQLLPPWAVAENLLPTPLRTLVFSAVIVMLMTDVIMPRMTRLFSFWLYPDRK